MGGGRTWEVLKTLTKSLGGRAHLCEALLDNYIGPPLTDPISVVLVVGRTVTLVQVRLGEEMVELVPEDEKAAVNGLVAGLGVVSCVGDIFVLSQVNIGPFHKLVKLG